MTTPHKESHDAARKQEKALEKALEQKKEEDAKLALEQKKEEDAKLALEQKKEEDAHVAPEKAPKTDNAGNLLNSKGDIVDGEGDVRYFAGTYTSENGNSVDLYKRRILPDQPRKAPNPAEGA